MTDWRKPSFDEAQVVIREEKENSKRDQSRILFVFIVPALLIVFMSLMIDDEVRHRSKEILGYDPFYSPVIEMENFSADYRKQQQEIANAKAQVTNEILAERVPLCIGLEVALAGIYLVIRVLTTKNLRRYAKHQFVVKRGVCVRKLYEGGDSFYLTAFFEKDSTQEARTSRDNYYKTKPYSELLIVHLTAHKEWTPRFVQAYVIGPPIPPTGKGPSQPKFMEGKKEDEEDEDYSVRVLGFESLFPPVHDDPSQPNLMSSKAEDDDRSADEIGEDLIGDEWKK
jgi:hypothetical protein